MPQLLDTLLVPCGAREGRIELYLGDLTSLTSAEAVDLLVVSAFPGDYAPTDGSLIGALHRKGVSVTALAEDKSTDLRSTFACWLSKEVVSADPGIQFRRILCFEPEVKGRPAAVVGDIFRSLAPFMFVEPTVRSVALPLVACGDQETPVDEMLDPLLDAATHWMASGFPLERLCIVERSAAKARRIQEAFGRLKAKYTRAEPPPPPQQQSPAAQHGLAYDVFVSYSQQNMTAADTLVAELRKRRPGIRVFLDRHELNGGAAWQRQIFKAIDQSHRFAALYSPEYMASKVCQEELQTACVRRRKYDHERFLFPIFLHDTELDSYHQIVQYHDCREADTSRLAAASEALLRSVDAG